jgi:hypothetical protein
MQKILRRIGDDQTFLVRNRGKAAGDFAAARSGSFQLALRCIVATADRRPDGCAQASRSSVLAEILTPAATIRAYAGHMLPAAPVFHENAMLNLNP